MIPVFIAAMALSPIRVACVGDSITDDIGIRPTYPAQLQQMLGPNYEVGNFGVSGMRMVRNFEASYWATDKFKKSMEFQPNIVVIMLGTNDSNNACWSQIRDRFYPDARALVNTYRMLPSKPKVFLGIPVPSFTQGDDREKYLATEIRPLLRQLAREENLPIIDFETPLRGRKDLYPDLLHPNPTGLGIMAQTVYLSIIDWTAMKKEWKVLSADSSQGDEGSPQAVIDGDPETIWHTQYSPKVDKYPHQIVIDFGSELKLSAFQYLPRQDGGTNGRVKGYEVYLSNSQTEWGQPVAKGELPNVSTRSVVPFANPVSARYAKFVALSEANGGPWASCAELDFAPAPPSQ
ncbi:MAG: discoidin domain-containing protein [Armatimonadetes bacterium]|nr:discoidin domain-containing protein [Armatimonadota bacterium]